MLLDLLKAFIYSIYKDITPPKVTYTTPKVTYTTPSHLYHTKKSPIYTMINDGVITPYNKGVANAYQ
jgi:hypothetical protein